MSVLIRLPSVTGKSLPKHGVDVSPKMEKSEAKQNSINSSFQPKETPIELTPTDLQSGPAITEEEYDRKQRRDTHRFQIKRTKTGAEWAKRRTQAIASRSSKARLAG